MQYDQIVILDISREMLQEGVTKNGNRALKAYNEVNFKAGSKGKVVFIELTPTELSQKGRLSNLTSSSKIILIGHGSPGASSISSKRLPDGSKERLTAKDLATYLEANLDPKKIAPFNAGGENKRKLIIQFCVCHAASDHNGDNSFIKRVNQELIQSQCDVDLVGYSATVQSQTKKNKIPAIIDPLSSMQVSKPGIGLNIIGLRPVEERQEIDPTTNQQRKIIAALQKRDHKMVFNRENPNGQFYDLRKEDLRKEVLQQFRIELFDPAFSEAGFQFGSQGKVPEGITQLRLLIEKHDKNVLNNILKERDFERATIGQAHDIIMTRLKKGWSSTIFRNDTTRVFYQKYSDILGALRS